MWTRAEATEELKKYGLPWLEDSVRDFQWVAKPKDPRACEMVSLQFHVKEQQLSQWLGRSGCDNLLIRGVTVVEAGGGGHGRRAPARNQ